MTKAETTFDGLKRLAVVLGKKHLPTDEIELGEAFSSAFPEKADPREKFVGWEIEEAISKGELATGGKYAEDETPVFLEDFVVVVADMERWLSRRIQKMERMALTRGKETPTAYLDPGHPCRAPKLTAAVEAWLAVSSQPLPRNKTPKQALEAWLRENADRLGLLKDDGTHNEQGIGEIAKVANWSPKGPPRTPED